VAAEGTAEVALIRRAYARQMLAVAGVADDPALLAAFAAVPREAFLGPPPWRTRTGAGPRRGDWAVEIDPALAEAARANLRGYAQVEVLAADAAAHPAAGEVDRVYVNASVGRPAAPWIDRLAPGGRLVFPLGVAPPARTAGGPRHADLGGAFLVERVAAGAGRPLRAEWLGPAYFVHAEGALAPDGAEAAALRRSLNGRGADFARSLHWGGPQPPPERCWFWSPGWSLGYDPPPG
jgi:protein-L-isoaspartate(D-aspartate) O-methyltransferase